MKKAQRNRSPHPLLLHYIKLSIRLTLFTMCLIIYIVGKVRGEDTFLLSKHSRILLSIIWVYFMLEMCLRSFPTPNDSIGAKKHFPSTYLPVDENKERTKEKLALQSPWRTALVAVVWIVPNLAIGILYKLGIFFDTSLMILLTLFYAVGDIVCILFFCPFQVFLMKNKCCSSCRIYNWDYAMMFTPFLFINSVYTHSLALVALFLLIEWEVLYRLHPERFSVHTNAAIRCEGCTEKLCVHKRNFWSFLPRKKHKKQSLPTPSQETSGITK